MSKSKEEYKIIVCLENSSFCFVNNLKFHDKENENSIEYLSDGTICWCKKGRVYKAKSEHWYQCGIPHVEENPGI